MLGYHRPQSGKYCEIGILKARVSFLNGTANTLEDSDCSSQRPCAPQDQWGSGERAFVPSRRQTHCSLYTDWSAERRVCGHRDKTGHTKADSRRDRGALSRSCASQAFFTASPPRSITRCERVPAQNCFGARSSCFENIPDYFVTCPAHLSAIIDAMMFPVAVCVRAQARVARAWGCCLQILRLVRSPTAIKLRMITKSPLEDIVNRRGESLHWTSTY
jgi:hypothetical protein